MNRLFIIFILLFAVGISYGQKKEMVTVPKDMLTADQKAKIEVKEKVEAAKEWGGIGKEIGEGATAIFEALNKNAVEFGNSGPGMALIGILAWKVIGTDFLQMVVGIPIWFIGTFLFAYSFRQNCTVRKLLVSKEFKERGKIFKIYDKKYSVVNDESDRVYERVGHIIFYFVFLGLCSAILFA